MVKYVMKNWNRAYCIFLFILMGIAACVKNKGSIEYNRSTNVLTISKPIIKKGEPLFVSTKAADSNSLIRWAIKPSDGALIVPDGNQATIYIILPGIYLITAKYYPLSDTTKAYDSSNSSIIVNDSIYTAQAVGSNFDTVALAGDQLTLIPISASDASFVLLVKTARLYNCSPYITAYGGGPITSTSIDFDFKSAEVVEGNGNCAGGKIPAIAFITLTPNPFSPGMFSVAADFDQVHYDGSLTATDSNYTFTWNYTSGIIISPLQIKKH